MFSNMSFGLCVSSGLREITYFKIVCTCLDCSSFRHYLHFLYQKQPIFFQKHKNIFYFKKIGTWPKNLNSLICQKIQLFKNLLLSWFLLGNLDMGRYQIHSTVKMYVNFNAKIERHKSDHEKEPVSTLESSSHITTAERVIIAGK